MSSSTPSTPGPLDRSDWSTGSSETPDGAPPLKPVLNPSVLQGIRDLMTGSVPDSSFRRQVEAPSSRRPLKASRITSMLEAQYGANGPQQKLTSLARSFGDPQEFNKIMEELGAIFSNPHELIPGVETLSGKISDRGKFLAKLKDLRESGSKLKSHTAIISDLNSVCSGLETSLSNLKNSETITGAQKCFITNKYNNFYEKVEEALSDLTLLKLEMIEDDLLTKKYNNILSNCDGIANRLSALEQGIDQLNVSASSDSPLRKTMGTRRAAAANTPERNIPPPPPPPPVIMKGGVILVPKPAEKNPLAGRATLLSATTKTALLVATFVAAIFLLLFYKDLVWAFPIRSMTVS